VTVLLAWVAHRFLEDRGSLRLFGTGRVTVSRLSIQFLDKDRYGTG
jgi:hypothetical protein